MSEEGKASGTHLSSINTHFHHHSFKVRGFLFPCLPLAFYTRNPCP